MQPGSYTGAFALDPAGAALLERVILAVRRHWFGAEAMDLGCAVGLVESGGELISLIDGDPAEAEALLADAALRGAYVVTTTFSRPADLVLRVRRHGFRLVQRHGVYVYDPGAKSPAARDDRRGLLARLTWREPLPVIIRSMNAGEIPLWNEVCWRAFGPRGTLEASLREKQQAFSSMAQAGTWYLAAVGERAVGTACRFRSPEASQVLAVGTVPASRGRGVASGLMERVIHDWHVEGGGPLFLDTNPGSVAERLYLRLGFRQFYIRELYAPVRGVGLT